MPDKKKKNKAASFADRVFRGKLKETAIEIEERESNVDSAVDSIANGEDPNELRIRKRKK